MPHTGEDSRLAKVTELCLALPESERRLNGKHADFRVRTKIFAYFLHNHHDDGIVAVCCKAEAGRNVERVAREPLRFYLPKYIGARGWFGLRLARRPVDWAEVGKLLELSYRLAAPRALIKSLGETARPRPRVAA